MSWKREAWAVFSPNGEPLWEVFYPSAEEAAKHFPGYKWSELLEAGWTIEKVEMTLMRPREAAIREAVEMEVDLEHWSGD